MIYSARIECQHDKSAGSDVDGTISSRPRGADAGVGLETVVSVVFLSAGVVFLIATSGGLVRWEHVRQIAFSATTDGGFQHLLAIGSRTFSLSFTYRDDRNSFQVEIDSLQQKT